MSSASKDANGEFDGDKHPKQLLGVQYIDIQWLSTYGLTKSNVLEYFYTSPFFNTNSNNQIIRIQGVEHAQRETILLSMTGVEYILDDLNTVEPNLFVIREQRRRSRRLADVDLINVYYVLDGIVFQCPDFLNLLKSRMSKTASYLTQSFLGASSTVRWVTADIHKEARQTASGLQVWASDDGEAYIEERASKTKDRPLDGRKYQRIIRDMPSFKAPLLDAHDAVFEE